MGAFARPGPPSPLHVGYGCDLRGNLTSIAYPGTTGTVTRTFDDAGRLWKIRDLGQPRERKKPFAMQPPTTPETTETAPPKAISSAAT
ncbi:MAG: hypothetical protein QOD57_890 [Actinomycetota bacterium]|jgi:hypothetical protein|nr:hypothetical protein [Actinomycetota bacterium]